MKSSNKHRSLVLSSTFVGLVCGLVLTHQQAYAAQTPSVSNQESQITAVAAPNNNLPKTAAVNQAILLKISQFLQPVVLLLLLLIAVCRLMQLLSRIQVSKLLIQTQQLLLQHLILVQQYQQSMGPLPQLIRKIIIQLTLLLVLLLRIIVILPLLTQPLGLIHKLQGI